MKIKISHHIPKIQIGHYIYIAHPFVVWLSKRLKFFPWLKFSPWTGFPMYAQQMLHDTVNNILWCSPAVYDFIKRESLQNDRSHFTTAPQSFNTAPQL